MLSIMLVPLAVILVVLAALATCLRVLPEKERGVVFRLGRVLPDVKGPGLLILMPGLDRLVRVSVVTQILKIPGAEIAYRVVDPHKAVLEVEDFRAAVAQAAGKLVKSSPQDLQRELEERTAPWGIRIERVEIA